MAMENSFLIDDEKINKLSATRQGRISIGGFTYQASYAVARLASMYTGKSILSIRDIPIIIRYDWAEDLDEIDKDGCTILTQCKRVDNIGQPANLAKVLLGFVPKWLWTPAMNRDKLRFRLICSDPQFNLVAPVALNKINSGSLFDKVVQRALGILSKQPSKYSDRALWEDYGKKIGYDNIIRSIGNQTEILCVPAESIPDDPTGVPLLYAERTALDLLVRWRTIDPDSQLESLIALRSTVHNNLVIFNPSSSSLVPVIDRTPQILIREDVQASLFEYDYHHNDNNSLFKVIGRKFLEDQASKEKESFIARPPEWADVVHGEDANIRFIERDITLDVLEKIKTHIINPINRGAESRLRCLFILGAPGSGKTTLLRRTASILIREGAATVIDPGVNLPELDDNEIEIFIADLSRLKNSKRPVLLLLDDPFFANSGWDTLLKRLTRIHDNLGVLGTSPNFLFEKFGASVCHKNIFTETITLPPPTLDECNTLARLNNRSIEHLKKSGDDFLVLAMVAATGESFSDIIKRIWTTLNDGHPINDFNSPETLPWLVKSFLIVCFFHRAFQRCPEALLREALVSVDNKIPPDLDYQLEHLALKEGWRIFSVQKPENKLLRHSGRTFSTTHHLIAQEAWRFRPIRHFDVSNWIIPASIRSELPFRVASLAGYFVDSDDNLDKNFANNLALKWNEKSLLGKPHVQTRNLAALATRLMMSGAGEAAVLLKGALKYRAKIPDQESWLALLTLPLLNQSTKEFLIDIETTKHIEVADFSIAPGRALRFFKAVRGSGGYIAIMDRLSLAFKGQLDWDLNSHLMHYYFVNSLLIALPSSR